MTASSMILRLAQPEDADRLRTLIDRSVRRLQANDYSASQLDAALGTVFGVDRDLIADRSYFVVEDRDQAIACGGWSRRATLFGVHQTVRDDRALTPGNDPARIRAFFVDPDHVRRGIGSLILGACELSAMQEGFTLLSLAATLTGAPFYRRRGFYEVRQFDTPLPNGEGMRLIAMEKKLPAVPQGASKNASMV